MSDYIPTYSGEPLNKFSNKILDEMAVGSKIASLVAGKIPTSQLPSYVDDILEYANLAAFPVIGETGKIYVALDTNNLYRWSGSIYIQIGNSGNAGLNSTADLPDSANKRYVTDAEKTKLSNTSGVNTGDQDLSGYATISSVGSALNAKQNIINTGSTAQYLRGDLSLATLNKIVVGLPNVDNTADTAKPVSIPTQTALDAKENSVTAGDSTQYYRGDKTFQILNKAAVGLPNVSNTDTTTTANITDSTDKRFVSDAQKTVIGNTSNTNSGDETLTSIKAKLLSANASRDGYLIQGDWNTFNNKQNAITSGTSSEYLKADFTKGTFLTDVNATSITYNHIDHGLITWSFDPAICNSVQISTPGQLYLIKLKVLVPSTVTNIIMAVSASGATLTSGQNFAGLYDSNRNLLSATADQSTSWNSTGIKTMPLITPQAIAAGTYYVGFYTNGTTQPTFRVGTSSGGFASVNLSTANSIYALSNTGVTTTIPNPAIAITGTSQSFWAALS